MGWVIGLVALCLFFSLTGGKNKPRKKKSRTQAVAIKDFIEAGKAYSVDEGKEVIRQFVVAMGDTEDEPWVSSADEIAESFPRLVERLKEEYFSRLRAFDEALKAERAHMEKQIASIRAQTDLDEYEKNEDVAACLEALRSEEKNYNRLIKWCEKQIKALDDNPTPVLRKALAFLKKERAENGYAFNLDESFNVDGFLKEPPL